MTVRTYKKHAFDVLISVFIIAAILHFSFKGVQGDYGLFTRLAVEKERNTLSEHRTTLMAEREALENMTLRLGDSYLDLDLLDERARDVLGYVRSSEVVIR
ncbi:MAG: septum formation initiator family protein [Pseudomonadota bacterium]